MAEPVCCRFPCSRASRLIHKSVPDVVTSCTKQHSLVLQCDCVSLSDTASAYQYMGYVRNTYMYLPVVLAGPEGFCSGVVSSKSSRPAILASWWSDASVWWFLKGECQGSPRKSLPLIIEMLVADGMLPDWTGKQCRRDNCRSSFSVPADVVSSIDAIESIARCICPRPICIRGLRTAMAQKLLLRKPRRLSC